MQHLLDENKYKKLDSCMERKIQSNLLRFLKKYKSCFTEPEWKFFKDKHHEVSYFYGLPKIHKSMIMDSSISTQNSEIIKMFDLNDFKKLRSILGGSKCPTRKPSQLMYY